MQLILLALHHMGSDMKAEFILSTKLSAAADLFPGTEKEIRKAFTKLAKQWHPDTTNEMQARAVFEHIIALRDTALDGQTSGSVACKANIPFVRPDGRTFQAKVLKTTVNDIGNAHIGANSISYEYGPDLLDIAQIETARIKGFRFHDDRMRAEMKKSLPELVSHVELKGGAALNIFKRPPGEVLLADLIEVSGYLPAAHAAWLCSGLMNIACYLDWSGIIHGAIGLDNVLVNPEKHSVRLVGGWGFSCLSGERPVMLPNRSLDICPAMVLKDYIPDNSLDLNLIRRTVNEAMGDPRGMSLRKNGVPEAVASFLTTGPDGSAATDYGNWMQALEEGWGKRRFVKFNMPAARVYS